MVENKFKVRKSAMCIEVEVMGDSWDSVFYFLLCRTKHYVLALFRDLDEFAWNHRLICSCAFLMGGALVVWGNGRRSRTEQLIVSVVRGWPDPAYPKTFGR
jgi:hypothetical protein